MDLEHLKEKLSLASLGAAASETLDDEYLHIGDWLKEGYNGDMRFLARDPLRRCDPKKIMPEVRTVIVAAMRYLDMPKKEVNEAACPLYLRHEDYHLVMMEKLEAITSEIKNEHKEAIFKCYVDTGPVLEKAWAAKAGLGFIGKNTLFISPKHGSQLAIGIILTNIELGAKRYPVSSCGSCRACMDACPTKAIFEPFKLDARKCISYKFFIEKKEGGCDICQNVCPFNKERL